jgi:hypothetical protein
LFQNQFIKSVIKFVSEIAIVVSNCRKSNWGKTLKI